MKGYWENSIREIRYILPGLVNLRDAGDGYGGGAQDYYWRNEFPVPINRMDIDRMKRPMAQRIESSRII